MRVEEEEMGTVEAVGGVLLVLALVAIALILVRPRGRRERA